MFPYIYMLCFGLVSYNYVAAVNAQVTLQSSNVMPIQRNNLTLSCLIQDVVNDNIITWYGPKSIIGTVTCYRQSSSCIGSTPGYTYTANQSGAYLDIKNINRDQDEGTWKCGYRGSDGMDIVRTLNITVYTLPSQLIYTKDVQTPTDLSLSNLTLECKTSDCTYPPPFIKWYYKTQTSPAVSGEYLIGTAMTSSVGPCSSQEKIYTSTLQIPLYTTWSDNSDKNITFYCGIEYPDPSRNIKSADSGTVRFAVAVTSVTLSISASQVVFYEGYPKMMCCISSPSRPLSTIRWFLGSSLLTDNITTTNTTDVTGLYICTSQIFLTLLRNASKQQIQCEGFIGGQQAVTSLEKPSVNIWYAPDVKVTLPPKKQNQTAMLICEAEGVPAQYTFYAWVHMWEDMVIRTGLHGVTSASQSILTIDRLSLESMGTYICTTNNGITGINGHINQTGSENLTVTGMPNILDNSPLFFGELGMSVNISIPVYSNPVIQSFAFQRYGTQIINNSRTMTLLTWDLVNYTFYGSMVKLKAQKAYFIIQNLTEGDFDNYTLELRNSIGKTDFRFQLDVFGLPFKVLRFYFNRFIDNQIELHFDPGFNGGPSQTFVIEEKSGADSGGVWHFTSITNLQETERQNQFKNGTFFVSITKPLVPGIYQYRMYSWNIKGKSAFSESITVIVTGVTSISEGLGLSVAGLAGGISAGIVCIIVIGIGIFFWRRNQHKTHSEHDNDVLGKHEERINQINANSVKQFMTSGKEYEGLHFTEAEANWCLPLNDIKMEENRNVDISLKSPERDSYEKLHPYANNDIQMYSSLKIPKIPEDSKIIYENTCITRPDKAAEYQNQH